jgi:hypothetical protein
MNTLIKAILSKDASAIQEEVSLVLSEKISEMVKYKKLNVAEDLFSGEQIDELSKTTLASYIPKAAHSVMKLRTAQSDYEHQADAHRTIANDPNEPVGYRNMHADADFKAHQASRGKFKKAVSRLRGVEGAAKRLGEGTTQPNGTDAISVGSSTPSIGDRVHMGHITPGGSGVKGILHKIDGKHAHIKTDSGNEYRGYVSNLSKE